MKIIKKVKRKKTRVRDSKKERVFRALSDILDESGYNVRREELKRGPNWRVVSGCCRAVDSDLIFVDRRLEQDEQIAFLLSRIIELGVTVNEEKAVDLPKSVQRALQMAKRGEASLGAEAVSESGEAPNLESEAASA